MSIRRRQPPRAVADCVQQVWTLQGRVHVNDINIIQRRHKCGDKKSVWAFNKRHGFAQRNTETQSDVAVTAGFNGADTGRVRASAATELIFKNDSFTVQILYLLIFVSNSESMKWHHQQIHHRDSNPKVKDGDLLHGAAKNNLKNKKRPKKSGLNHLPWSVFGEKEDFFLLNLSWTVQHAERFKCGVRRPQDQTKVLTGTLYSLETKTNPVGAVLNFV